MRNNLNAEFVHHNQCHAFVAIKTVPGYECQCIGGDSVLFRERSEAGVINLVNHGYQSCRLGKWNNVKIAKLILRPEC